MNKTIKTAKLALVALFLMTLIACTSQDTDDIIDGSANNDSLYTDGVYTAVGEYGNLPSHITVTLTLTNGIISATRVEPQATNPTSLDLQRRFAAAVPEIVNGKHISQVNVGRLAGSSGTPRGFNDAIRQIKIQALQGQ
jgi:hypothetical protein